MAVAAFTKSALFRGVLGIFGDAGRSIAPTTIARRLLREYPELTGLNFASAQAIATQAQRAWEAGRMLNRRSINPLQRTEHPIDPTLGPGDSLYRYRVLVQLYEGGAVTASQVVEVDSDINLTRQQLNALAMTLVDQTDTPRRGSVRAAMTVNADAIPLTTVLTAGRRA